MAPLGYKFVIQISNSHFTRSRHTPRKRSIQYAANCRFYHRRLGILDHPLSRMVTTESVARSHFINHDSAFSRRNASEACSSCPPEKQRAQGKPGARCTRSLARSV
jgi:hypothetical protein